MRDELRVARRTLLRWLAQGAGVVAFGAACSEAAPPAPAARTRSLLARVADVLLPGDGVLPAASALGIERGLERYHAERPDAARLHETRWIVLDAALDGRTDAELADRVGAWYAELRAGGTPSREAVLFEALRRELLRVYYTHPEVHELLGYGGPPVLRGV